MKKIIILLALAVALLCVASTLLATLLQLEGRVGVMAGALLAGAVLALGVALATWWWGL